MTSPNELAALLASVDATALLAELLKKSDAKQVREALKKAEAEKPTTISLTMEYVVRRTVRGESVLSDAAMEAVTAEGRECGLFKADEKPQASTVAALVRYALAHDAAYQKGGYVPVLASDVHALGGSVINGRLFQSMPDGTAARVVPDASQAAPEPAGEPKPEEAPEPVSVANSTDKAGKRR